MAQLARLTAARRLPARAAALALAAALAVPAAASAAEKAAEKAGEFVPGKPPSAQYGPDGSRKCAMTPVFRYVLDELAGAAKRAGRPAPQADGQACAVAEALLAWDPAALGNPRPQVLAFVSRWFGLPITIQPPVVATFETKDERAIAERIVQSAAGSSALNAVNAKLGISVQQGRRGRDALVKVAIVVLDAPLEMAPLPRRLEKGQSAVLSGKLIGGAKDPKVFVSDPQGKLLAPEQPPGDAFKAELQCGDRPGQIWVEIRGELDGAPGLVASFPVACAEAPPAAIAIAGEAWPTDAAAAEKKMFENLNAERKAAGAPPLTWDPAIAGVARSISEDLAARGGVPGGPDILERLKKEGIASPLVLQSAAAERTFERAQDRILSSPRDRATVLNAEANMVGVGAFTKADEGGRPIVYVTEVLIKELPPLDVAKVRQDLRDAVAQKRKDARTNPVSPDATLDEVAQKFAETLAAAGGTLSKEKATELTAPLNKSFRTVTMISGAKQEPLDFAEEPQTTAAGKLLGVGVAQGRHPVLGRNAVYVVLMVGTARGGTEEASAAPTKKKKATTTPTATKPKK